MTDILSISLSCAADVAESSVGDETVLLHLGNGTYYGLDPVGTRIWALVKGGMVPQEICQLLSSEYGVDLATIEADARKFLRDLLAQGILIDG